MQFVANGPEIPDSLLQAHEEDNVVFFCGAGISIPAGLPGFKELVDRIYNNVGTSLTDIEEEAYGRKQYDSTLNLLERRLPSQRNAVRRALMDVLQPNICRKGALDTHAALLQLARNSQGNVRLVTTNYDRIFEEVAVRSKHAQTCYVAPMLPIPKKSRWNGVVYLHGLLPERLDEYALNRLVLTSGDFGLAYLTERWAARFVSEMFRNHVVCFVGYSINDPVLRYMMDALAADRMQGEASPKAYALVDYYPGQEHDREVEWEAKGVAPILYEVPTGSDDHSVLHDTLKSWANTYRDGILGRENIVTECARAHPSASSRQDDFVGRMLWALSHESGLPAKRFADHNPVPPLAWLETFSEDRFQHADLIRFGVPPSAVADKKLRFSFINRPSPYTHASWMSLVSGGVARNEWDIVMFNLARWLVRHLNDPALIIWLARRGGQLRGDWSRLIENELNRFAKLESEGRTKELEEIRNNAPNAIPSQQMIVLWRMLLSGRTKPPWNDLDLYHWIYRFSRDGLTASMRLELREMLTPKFVFKEPFRWDAGDVSADTNGEIGQLVDWELALVVDDVYSSLPDLRSKRWCRTLPMLLDDFQQLLRDALDLLQEMGAAGERFDRSYVELPSITPHWQNRNYRDWVSLIQLLRDAWLETARSNPERASRIAQNWFDIPYPTFKRLALFAASHDGSLPSDQWTAWLITEDAWWLWSNGTRRETLRLLVLQGASMSAESRSTLEAAILAGPSRSMYREDIRDDEWQLEVDSEVWIRLKKLLQGGAKLGVDAQVRFETLSSTNSTIRLPEENERDEFIFWTSGTGDPDFEDNRVIDIAPKTRSELAEWLNRPSQTRQPFYEDDWFETCNSHFSLSVRALCDLAQENIWPPERWGVAFQAWCQGRVVLRAWRFIAPLSQRMPEDMLKKIAHSITRWLEAVSGGIDRHEPIFLDLCRRLLLLLHQDGVGSDEPVTRALNHPIGHITQALLKLWFGRKPGDNEGLPGDIEPYFTQFCASDVKQFRHARVILGSRLISLFRVDRVWTEANLLPLFDWSTDPTEAQAVWKGFLWSPRIHRPLFVSFKPQFLETARHYSDLGEHGRQFSALLTHAALDHLEGYTDDEFREAVGGLPQGGIEEVARALSQALQGAGEQREEFWRNRIQPFWHNVWPKSRELNSNGISESLARMCIGARGEFPVALSTVIDWLQPLEHPSIIVRFLYEADLTTRYPEDALRLLDAVIENQSWPPSELGKCLSAIKTSAPKLLESRQFQRLEDYLRRHGRSADE